MTDKKTMTAQEAFDSLARTMDTIFDQIEALEKKIEERRDMMESNIANISNLHFKAHEELEKRVKKLEGAFKKSPVCESRFSRCPNCGEWIPECSDHRSLHGYMCHRFDRIIG